jgi:hypothetical protein
MSWGRRDCAQIDRTHTEAGNGGHLIAHRRKHGGRVAGPMKFRLILQPTMAVLLAIHSGIKDARVCHPPYFWTIATDPTARAELLKDGWHSIGKVFMLALALDVLYQRSAKVS